MSRALPFVAGCLSRDAAPLETPDLRIEAGERNPFVARRRGTINAPAVSVLVARALWALADGQVSVRYLAGQRPKIMVQTSAFGASLTTGRSRQMSGLETVLFDITTQRVTGTGPLLQSPSAVALFAALDLYDRRRGIDFAPAYLAFLRAKSGPADLARARLLAASDELIASMLLDYGTDRSPAEISWHVAPRAPELERMFSSDKVKDISEFGADARALSAHRPNMLPYQPRASIIAPAAADDLRDGLLELDDEPVVAGPDLGAFEETHEIAPEMPEQAGATDVVPALDQADLLVRELGVSDVASRLLVSRGLDDPKVAAEFLRPRTVESHDPYEMKGMFAVATRVHRAITNREQIVIYGDYDADGIPGTALLLTYLRSVGAKVVATIPNRQDGYGLSLTAATRLIEEHAPDLVITIDCGSSDHDAIHFLQGRGVEVVVTDHHLTLKGAPPTPYFINPNRADGDDYPFHDLCGCGVAYKLVQALAQPNAGELYAHVPELYDFVMVSTVGDQVSLTGENRYYVRAGLEQVNKKASANLGLWAIVKEAGIFLENMDAVDIGWKIAPRINAIGRMGMDPTLVVDLLTTSSHEKAAELADTLDQANGSRQGFTDKLYQQAQEILGDSPRDEVLGVYLPDATVGVAGLVAAKITERYHRPTLVVNAEGRGSGRAPDGQQIIGHMETLREAGIFGRPRRLPDGTEITADFGGHTGACGFHNVEVEPFLAAVRKLKNIAPGDAAPRRRVDAAIRLDEVTPQLARELQKMGPYGVGNPEPSVAITDLEIVDPKVSKSGHSLLFSVKQGDTVVRAHWFGGGKFAIKDLPARVDILANPVVDRSGKAVLGVTNMKPSLSQPAPVQAAA